MKGVLIAGVVLVLGVTVAVVQMQTGFINQAAGSETTYVGKVEKVTPCVQGNLCFKLGSQYLLARRGWFYSTGPFLEPFVGKNVTISGWEVKRANGKSFILVKSVMLLPEPTPIPPGATPVPMSTCRPRPSCLDADYNEYCNLAVIPPGGWCPSCEPIGSCAGGVSCPAGTYCQGPANNPTCIPLGCPGNK